MTTSTNRFRATASAACLIAAPLVLLVGALLHPAEKKDVAEQVAIVAANANRWYVAHVLLLVGVVLFVPVVLELMRLLRGRAEGAATVAGTLSVIGLFGVFGIVSIDGLAGWKVATSGINRIEAVSVMKQLINSAGIGVPLAILGVLFTVGLLVFSVALYRTRVVPAHTAVLVGVGGVAIAIGSSGVQPVLWLAFVLVLAGLGELGLRQLGLVGSGSTGRAAREIADVVPA